MNARFKNGSTAYAANRLPGTEVVTGALVTIIESYPQEKGAETRYLVRSGSEKFYAYESDLSASDPLASASCDCAIRGAPAGGCPTREKAPGKAARVRIAVKCNECGHKFRVSPNADPQCSKCNGADVEVVGA